MNECSHAKSEPRKRTKGNGTVVVTTQCLDCGRSLGEKPKAQFNVQQLEDYDEALKDQVGDSKAPEREAARLETAQDWGMSFAIECVGICVACHERLHGTR